MTLVLAELAAGIGLLKAFGVHLSGDEIFAITQFVEVSLALGLWARSRVAPGGVKPAPIPPAGTPQSA
jgi:hypothetical protein